MTLFQWQKWDFERWNKKTESENIVKLFWLLEFQVKCGKSCCWILLRSLNSVWVGGYIWHLFGNFGDNSIQPQLKQYLNPPSCFSCFESNLEETRSKWSLEIFSLTWNWDPEFSKIPWLPFTVAWFNCINSIFQNFMVSEIIPIKVMFGIHLEVRGGSRFFF